jgi:hypothetical protein
LFCGVNGKKKEKESNVSQSLSSNVTDKQASLNKVELLTSKVVELSFRPEPELWIQKRVLIE